MVEERIRTYIDAFDSELGGGIPKGHIVLIAGTTGTMKSSLTYYIMYSNARTGIRGSYISLEQPAISLSKQMRSLKMNCERVWAHLTILDLPMIRRVLEEASDSSMNEASMGKSTFGNVFGEVIETVIREDVVGHTILNVLKEYIKAIKTKFEVELLAIDSLPVLELTAGFTEPRRELFCFFEWLRNLELTTFMISEMPNDSARYASHDIDFVADGIIHLMLHELREGEVQRRLRCVKMRGTDHNMSYFTLLYNHGRFEVSPAIGR
jgi:KaiC/GvpD/RAD55 family RecA-like ATPase